MRHVRVFKGHSWSRSALECHLTAAAGGTAASVAASALQQVARVEHCQALPIRQLESFSGSPGMPCPLGSPPSRPTHPTPPTAPRRAHHHRHHFCRTCIGWILPCYDRANMRRLGYRCVPIFGQAGGQAGGRAGGRAGRQAGHSPAWQALHKGSTSVSLCAMPFRQHRMRNTTTTGIMMENILSSSQCLLMNETTKVSL